MAIFTTLLKIFEILILINIVLIFSFYLWTRHRSFKFLTWSWIFNYSSFSIQRLTPDLDPFMRIVWSAIPNFLVHYVNVLVLAVLLKIQIPLRPFIVLALISYLMTAFLFGLGATPFWFALPYAIFNSTFYFYLIYLVLKYHREGLTTSMKSSLVVYFLYGLHILDWAYFYTRLELLSLGFTLAMVFTLGFTIFVPLAILEKISEQRNRKSDFLNK